MDQQRHLCPNCGHDLVHYRSDQTWSSGHDVRLTWFMCVTCQHVSLQNWAVVDHVDTEPQTPQSPNGIGTI